MPQFKPFKGFRPNTEFTQTFVSRSVDKYSAEELEKTISQSPYSFVEMISPTWTEKDLPQKERYAKVRDNFEKAIQDDWLKEDKVSFYIYEQETDTIKVRGIIGLVSIDDFNEQKIRKHEETLAPRKQMFAEYIKQAEIYSEPVLLMHQNNQRIDLLTDLEMKKSPTVEFKDDLMNNHRLWMIKDRLIMKQIKESVEKMDAIYIADGHHRMGSSAIYTEHRRANEKSIIGNESFNYTLALLVDEKQLIVKDFNRVIKDLNGHSKEEFLHLLEEKFVITKKDKPYFPSKKHHISMVLDGEFYSLYVKPEFRGKPKGLGELDTYLFEENILKPILNIHDTRNDKRIGFVSGTGNIDGIIKMQEKVENENYKVGFGFFPICTDDLRLIADLELKMPPKSTFIEPKLLSGLVISDLK